MALQAAPGETREKETALLHPGAPTSRDVSTCQRQRPTHSECRTVTEARRPCRAMRMQAGTILAWYGKEDMSDEKGACPHARACTRVLRCARESFSLSCLAAGREDILGATVQANAKHVFEIAFESGAAAARLHRTLSHDMWFIQKYKPKRVWVRSHRRHFFLFLCGICVRSLGG